MKTRSEARDRGRGVLDPVDDQVEGAGEFKMELEGNFQHFQQLTPQKTALNDDVAISFHHIPSYSMHVFFLGTYYISAPSQPTSRYIPLRTSPPPHMSTPRSGSTAEEKRYFCVLRRILPRRRALRVPGRLRREVWFAMVCQVRSQTRA